MYARISNPSRYLLLLRTSFVTSFSHSRYSSLASRFLFVCFPVLASRACASRACVPLSCVCVARACFSVSSNSFVALPRGSLLIVRWSSFVARSSLARSFVRFLLSFFSFVCSLVRPSVRPFVRPSVVYPSPGSLATIANVR